MLVSDIFRFRLRCIQIGIVLISLSFILFVRLSQVHVDSNSSPTSGTNEISDSCLPWKEWSQSYRRCIVQYLEADSSRSAWLNLHEAQTYCAGQSTLDMININHLPNVKLVILPSPTENTVRSECIEVTLGIGGDIESEKKLLQLLPCQMHGADPVEDVGRVFEQLGQYYEMAVGAETGIFNASVLVGPGIWDYGEKSVPTTAFIEFITKHVNHTKIDYLFVDNEGAEYDILPLFIGENSAAKVNEIIVCQWSVEMHGPLAEYGMTDVKYDELVRHILTSSPFIPLWSTAPVNHIRMFLLNANDDYCVKKYLQKWC